jgi:hypothetical protein
MKGQNIIAEDEATHGAMFVAAIGGSDKTTVSVATGHQEYHPVYVSPSVLTNPARRGHGNAVLPAAFLPIPKSTCLIHALLALAHIAQLLKNIEKPRNIKNSSDNCTMRVSHSFSHL